MSNRTEIKVPDIGDFDKVPVIEVLVSEGDTIEEEQSLVTLESDKATMEVPSSRAGKLVELKVKEGDEVSEGDVIGIVEVEASDEKEDAESSGKSSEESESEGDDREPEAGSRKSEGDAEASEDEESSGGSPETGNRKPETEKSEASEKVESSGEKPDAGKAEDLPAPPVPFTEMGSDPSSIPHASPAVRKLARELGAELSQVKGSGEHGRITAEDLKQHVKSRMESGPAASGTRMDIAEWPKVDFSKFGEVEEKKLSRIQKISGPNLLRNWVGIPHVTQFDEADITEMEAFRKAAKPEAEEAGTKMTPLVFMIKAVVAGLKTYPKFNTSLSSDGESLVYKKYFHVGVAVDTPNGLMVPVIRDADTKSLLELAKELTELSGKARDGKLSRDEMQGGCMSISSLGGIGGTAFTPIINAPEVAILGVSKAEMKPVWNGEKFKPRLMLPLSLSYDHRVIDGADAARFTQYLAHVLGDVRRLML
ncbi:MAG: branched-chain alpha-keto acid dehydrogenase subunit E2 [Xanthomonadales bacterium]|nr:branched-chain alpha-keto acid dehydrogenase subunit E2 [Xanthomonadales bacterium]|tara:strand:+ start:1122 stop:2561 length:1440 start_codon:yes stop_codon:yes gene_type:complete